MNSLDGPFRQSLTAAALVIAALATPMLESTAQMPSPLPRPAPSPVTGAEDARIVVAVRSAINSDALLAGTEIHVGSDNGMVVLAGTVREVAQIRRAVDVASSVAGVKLVSSSLSVQSA
jgi:osmotically-inducible protein OsmY